MKLVSWNVNGIRAVWKKGFREWLDGSGADVVFLQETKADPNQLEKEIREIPGWGSRFLTGDKKGYSGVAVYYREEPDAILEGLDVERFDNEGRVIGVRYGDLFAYGMYFPNSGRGTHRVVYKMDFWDTVLARMNQLREDGLDVLLCGDLNCAHTDHDIAKPRENENTAGFLPEERAWMDRTLAEGWVDTWRHVHPHTREVYSWWSYQTIARPKNEGWRIDYFLCDEAATDRIQDATIEDHVEGSDHAPVTLTMERRG